MQKKVKIMVGAVKEGMGNIKGKLKNKAATAYMFLMCYMGFAMTTFAAPNPVENARVLVLDYLKPLVYIGCAIFGGVLIVKRKTSELISFIIVAGLAILLIFYSETAVTFLGGIVQKLFG